MKVRGIYENLRFAELLDEYGNDFRRLAEDADLPEDFIDYYWPKLKAYRIEFHQTITPFLMEKYGRWLNWKTCSKYQDIPEEMIERYAEKVNWRYVGQRQKMSGQFIRRHSDKLFEEDLERNPFLEPDWRLFFRPSSPPSSPETPS